MEERISFKRVIETPKIFHIIILFSILFQAAAFITDYNISLLSINGTDNVFPQANTQSCLSKINQPFLKMKDVMKEHPYSISVAKLRTLRQPRSLEITVIQTFNPWILNGNTNDAKKYINQNIRKYQDIQWANKLLSSKQNIRASDRRTRNILSSWKNSGNKAYSQLLGLTQSINSYKVKENNRRHTEYELSHVTNLSHRTSEPKISRRSIQSRNLIVREMRVIRQTKNGKERIKTTRNTNRLQDLPYNVRHPGNYARNSFARLSEKDRQNYLKYYSNFPQMSTQRKYNEKQSRISIDRSDQGNVYSDKSIDKHEPSFANLMLENKIEKSRNTYPFFGRIQYAQHSMRSSIKNAETQQRRRAMKRVQNIIYTKQLLEFQNIIMADKIRSMPQNTRYYEKIAPVIFPVESPSIQVNIQLSRKLVRYIRSTESKRQLGILDDTRVINGRYTERLALNDKDKTQSRNHIQDRSHIKRTLQSFTEKSLNMITLKQINKRKISDIKQLYNVPVKTFSVIPSEISMKGIQASRQLITLLQQTQCKKGFERLMTREDRRVSNLEKINDRKQYSRCSMRQQIKYIERQQKTFHSENIPIRNAVKLLHSHVAHCIPVSVPSSNRRTLCTGFSGRFLNRQRNYLTSRAPIKRALNNRLLSEALQRRIQHREVSQQLSERSQYIARSSERSVQRNFYFKDTVRLLSSRFNRKYLVRAADKIVLGTIRSIQHFDQPIVRNEAIEAYKIFREEHRRETYIDERKYVRISEISHNSRTYTFHLKQSDFRKYYRYSDKSFVINVAEVFIEKTNKESGYKYSQYSFKRTRIFPKITSRIEIIATSLIEQKHWFKSYGVQSQIYNLPKLARNLNDDAGSLELTSLKSKLLLLRYQKSSTEEKVNAINSLWNTVANVLRIFHKSGLNVLKWKTACIGNSLNTNDRKKKPELLTLDQMMTKSLLRNWIQRYGIQDAVIAGIVIFASIKLYSAKSMDYEIHSMNLANIGYGI